MPLAMPAPVVMRVPSLSIRSYQGGRVGAETCSRLRLTFERAVSPSCAHRRENPRLDDPKPGAWLSRTRGTLCAPILPPPWHELTLRLGTRITTGVLTMPAASVLAFRKFADRVEINSFAELRSGQEGRSGGEKLVPALPNRALFENRSAARAQL